MGEQTLGQVGYDAYGNTAGWLTFDGRPMPRWIDLGNTATGRETQRRWEVAASEIASEAIKGHMGADHV